MKELDRKHEALALWTCLACGFISKYVYRDGVSTIVGPLSVVWPNGLPAGHAAPHQRMHRHRKADGRFA
jgi:hypothetical protein